MTRSAYGGSGVKVRGVFTAMTIDASNEKQKPISVHTVLNLAGLSLPSRSMRACMLSPSVPPSSRAIQGECAQAVKHSSWFTPLHLQLSDYPDSWSYELHCEIVPLGSHPLVLFSCSKKDSSTRAQVNFI